MAHKSCQAVKITSVCICNEDIKVRDLSPPCTVGVKYKFLHTFFTARHEIALCGQTATCRLPDGMYRVFQKDLNIFYSGQRGHRI